MKNFITLLAVVFCAVLFTHESHAQGNLQFNQVILFSVPQNTTAAFTVPAGKVWKIESFGVGGTSSTSILVRDASANTIAYLCGAQVTASLPFWLPSSFSGSFQSTGTNPYRDVISIIEFNVVP